MGFKAFLILAMFMVTIFVASTDEVAPGDLDEKFEQNDGNNNPAQGVDESKLYGGWGGGWRGGYGGPWGWRGGYGGPWGWRGGYGGPWGWRGGYGGYGGGPYGYGGGYCPYGCCGWGYYGCYRCCYAKGQTRQAKIDANTHE
ncbi:glycine-rich cell wall structural protein-like [Arachis stenosperma]|uniref:glycine-rich cell wall structural protein-like n=1 Tax=Arachis stenosperma TaxID=217475 RepID=UPI0025ACB214|nr:glycine-rich cell wall structural protein-like [Arachis stenosperma]